MAMLNNQRVHSGFVIRPSRIGILTKKMIWPAKNAALTCKHGGIMKYNYHNRGIHENIMDVLLYYQLYIIFSHPLLLKDFRMNRSNTQSLFRVGSI